MIFGIDHGYSFTKVVCENGERNIFASQYMKGSKLDSRLEPGIEVEFENQKYIVGRGAYTVEQNKIKDTFTMISTLCAIGLSVKDSSFIEADIVVGLPIEFFKQQKDEFKDTLKSYGQKSIKINGENKDIKINKIEVFMQSSGIPFINHELYRNKDSLIIDWGGLTVDCSNFSGNGLQLFTHATLKEGIFKLYEKLTQYLNAEYEISLSVPDMDVILRRGYWCVDGKKYSTELLTPYIDSYVQSVVTNIKTQFDTRIVDNVTLIGGASQFLYPFIKRYLYNVKLFPNSQFANSESYLRIGELRFER